MHITLLLNPDSEYTCETCSKSFHSKESLYKHSRGVHTKKDPCKFCNRLLKYRTRPDNYRKHLVKCRPFLELVHGDFKSAVDHTIRHVLTEIRSQ